MSGTSTPLRRAGILARISQDRDGDAESPDQQLDDGETEAARRGLEVVERYVERDVSGYKRSQARPEYDRLIADMRAGRLDVVIVWAVDRLTRQGVVGIGRFLEVMEETGVELVSVTQPFIDSTTPLGRAVLGLVAGLAEQESANTSTRVKRAQRYAAREGKYLGGGYRPYGYRRRGDGEEGPPLVPMPVERDAIREAVVRVLAGESLRSIAKDWNARGLRTTAAGKVRRRADGTERAASGEWSARTLSLLLRSPVLAALIERDGERYPGGWEAILTPAEHDEVVRALTGQPLADRRSRSYLVTGLARCGRCDQRLVVKWAKGTARYACASRPGSGACGRLAASLERVDEAVTAEILDFLTNAKLRPLEGADDEEALRQQHLEAQGALAALVQERFVRRRMSAAEYEAAREPLEREIEHVERRLEALARARAERTLALPLGDREALEAWWDGADAEERRAAAHWALRRVEVAPAGRGGGSRFDPARVRVAVDWSVAMLAGERALEGLTDEERDEAYRAYMAECAAAEAAA